MYNEIFEILRKRNPSWSRERLANETSHRLGDATSLNPDKLADEIIGVQPMVPSETLSNVLHDRYGSPQRPTEVNMVEPTENANDGAVVGVPDDLTKIKGIGKKIAEKLAERDITGFAQIAELTDQEIIDLDDMLSFKGRIVREKWVEQAQAILQE